MKFSNFLIITALASALLVGCKKDDPEDLLPETGYSVPSTYSFSGADYADASTRLTMLQKIDSVTGKGTTTQVDANVLKNMFSNTGSPFIQSELNTSGLQIKDKTVVMGQVELEKFMDSVALNSNDPIVTYAAGTAGVATANNGTSKYLLNEYGVEYRQVLSKAFMGAVLLNQIQQHLSDVAIGSTVAKTTRAENWDMAFGYFGVPVDFPTNTTDLKYLGNYANNSAIKAVIPYNTIIMNAFLTGRAAIENDDQATVNAQADIIVEKIEELLAAAAAHYMNDAKVKATDFAAMSHSLSEGIGFIYAIKFAGRKISDSEVDTILGYLGTDMNSISTDDMMNARDEISTIYGFDVVKGNLKVKAE